MSHSSYANSPNLMSSWLFSISGSFISDFRKLSLQILEMFFPLLKTFLAATFSIALEVIFLLLILLTVCHANRYCLSLTEFIILLSDIGLAVRVFANGPGDLGSISGCVIPKTQKMVLDASLLNTQY